MASASVISALVIVALSQAGAPYAPFDTSNEAQAERMRTRYREQCISQAGAAMLAADWLDRSRPERARERIATQNAVEAEVRAAAASAPIDVERLTRALRRRAEAQVQANRESSERGIAHLLALSPADRAIYARGMTYWTPTAPAQRCDPSTGTPLPGDRTYPAAVMPGGPLATPPGPLPPASRPDLPGPPAAVAAPSCLSKAGDDIMRRLSRDAANLDGAQMIREQEALQQEIAFAALAVPLDVERLARAKRADADDQARALTRRAETTIAIVQALSPGDRQIFMQPVADGHARRGPCPAAQ